MYAKYKVPGRLMLILMLVSLMAGCDDSRRRNLLETIPAASSAIIHADADRLLKMAGCNSRGGAITLTADIESLLQRDTDALSLLAECARMGADLDLTQLYAFRYDSCWIVTAPIKIESDLAGAGESRKLRGLGRARVSSPGRVSLLTFGGQAWMSSCAGDTLCSRLERIMDAADNASVSQYKPVSAFLPQTDALLAGYVALPLVRNPLGHDFNALLVTVDGTDRQLTAAMRMLRNGFPANATDSMKMLDPEALDYMPGGAIASFAIGLDKGAIARLMPWARQFPLASQLVVNAISVLADPDGGTLALGIAPGGSAETIKRLSLDSWLFKAVLPIADKGEDLATLINQVTTDRLYSESDSAYLAITNYDPEYYPSDYAVAIKPGAMMQARLSIGYRSQVMKAFGLTSGYMMEAWAADSTLRAAVSVLGPSQYLLPGLIKDLSVISKR